MAIAGGPYPVGGKDVTRVVAAPIVGDKVDYVVVRLTKREVPDPKEFDKEKAQMSSSLALVKGYLRERVAEAVARDTALAHGVNVLDGKVTYEAVAEAHGLDYAPLEDVLPLSPV